MVDGSGRSYGSVGEVHPRVAAAWDLPGRPVMAALHLDPMLALDGGSEPARPVPAAQPIDRDLAVVISDDTPVGELLRLTRRNAGSELVELQLFDVYRGPQVGPGRASYGLALRFQPSRPGGEETVDKAMDKIRGALKHHLGAEIR